MIDELISKVGRMIVVPDIRKVYKLRREITHFLVHHAVKMNDGHYDEYIKARDGYDILVRVYPPEIISPKRRIILFFHGGGWVISDVDNYHRVCRQMAQITGSYVLSVDYRLAPEYKFPVGLEDCYTVAKRVFADARRRGFSSRDIILAGDSAGGNLAAAVALKARETGDFRVRREILLYPVTACDYSENSPYKSVHEKGTGCFLTTERMRGFMELYVSDISQLDDPYVAPIKAASFEKMPETLIITAENDPLRDEGEAYGRKLKESGCYVKVFRMKKAYHGFFTADKRSPFVKRAYSKILYFFSQTD
ncbi:MAG: alpha/beta hydrolase [Huintestinicola sp.]